MFGLGWPSVFFSSLLTFSIWPWAEVPGWVWSSHGQQWHSLMVTCVRFPQVFGSTPAEAVLPQLRSSIPCFPVLYHQLLLEQTRTEEAREEPIWSPFICKFIAVSLVHLSEPCSQRGIWEALCISSSHTPSLLIPYSELRRAFVLPMPSSRRCISVHRQRGTLSSDGHIQHGLCDI